MLYLERSLRHQATLLALSLTISVSSTLPSLADADPTLKGSVAQPDSGPKKDTEAKSAPETAEKSDKEKAADSGKQKAEEKGGLTAEKINSLLGQADAYGEGLKVSSVVQGNDVTVQTWINPKSKDVERDTKIDSVLVSKKLLDTFPTISSFKYRYFDISDRNRYLEITVMPTVVTSFASGSLSDKDLLATLPSTWRTSAPSTTAPINASSMSSVLAGPMQVEREQALQIILRLEKAGVGVGAFRALLATVEEHIRAGRTAEASTGLSRLVSSLGDQQRALQKAKTTKPTGPVRGSSASSSSGSSSALAKAPASVVEGIAIYKKKYGDFYPHYGPMYIDRVYIAQKIDDLKRANQPVDQFREAFRQMEESVVNNKPGLEQSVRYFNQTLGLKEQAHDDEYKLQQSMADKNRGLDK